MKIKGNQVCYFHKVHIYEVDSLLNEKIVVDNKNNTDIDFTFSIDQMIIDGFSMVFHKVSV